MRIIFGGVAACAVLFASVMAVAQDVTLTARDGGLSFAGQLIGFDGEFYRIDTTYGRLTVDAEGVLCDGPACPALTAPLAVIRIAGAAEPAQRLLPALFAAFAASRGLRYAPGVPDSGFAAEISDPTTGQALARISFAALPHDQAARALTDQMVDLVLDHSEGAGLRARAVAQEPLIAIVAAENRLPQARSADLAAALTGKLTNWQDLGGPDMPIVVHALAENSALQSAISARLGAAVTAGPRHPDAASLARAVARDPWALALTGQSFQGPARALALTDSCDFPLPVTPLTVKAQDYPLTASLFLLTPPRRLPLLAREFLEFLATDAAQQAVALAGYIDRRMGRAPLTEDGQRLLGAIRNTGADVSLTELQRLAAAMTGGERLSLTFRFLDGSSQLDAASRENLGDLARLIASGALDGQRLTLARFSDGTGQGDVNLALSRSRAEAVRSGLRALAPDLSDDHLPDVAAFGEALPMACDTTAAGRQVNRRVELWAHPHPDAAP